MKARNHARRFEAKVHLLVVLHAVSKRSEVLYRRGACIRIAPPRRGLRKGRIRRPSQLRSRNSRQMARARFVGPDFWANEGPESALPRGGGPSARLRHPI